MINLINQIRNNKKIKTLFYLTLIPIISVIFYTLYYFSSYWFPILYSLAKVAGILVISYCFLTALWIGYKNEGMLGYLKVIIAVIIVLFLIYILFYKWETLGKPILFILVLWTIAVLIFKLIWEVLKFPITAFSEKYRFTDPSLFHVFFFYFIPIHLITCCFSLFLWFSKEHLLFWEEAKELIWALCPIANIFYALDIWIKLYLYLNALLFA